MYVLRRSEAEERHSRVRETLSAETKQERRGTKALAAKTDQERSCL